MIHEKKSTFIRSEESMERLIQTVSRDEERYKDKIQ